MQIQLVQGQLQELMKSQRSTRSPMCDFYCSGLPMQIVPHGIHPVLANETLTSVKFECRTLTDPLAAQLSGCAQEFYLFYVKLSDLTAVESAVKAMITAPFTPYVNATAANTSWYHNGGGVNWLKLCYDRIVETYFRTEQEGPTDFLVGDYALAPLKLHKTGPFASIAEAADVTGLSDLGDLTSSAAIDQALEAYQLLNDNGLLGNMSYEDFLRQVGARVSKEVDTEPELLFSWRDWKYPASTVDGATGAVSTVMSYVFDDTKKARKAFKEWGFLVMLSVFRPKFIRKNQGASVVNFMDRGISWMPEILAKDPRGRIRIFADSATDGPLGISQAGVYGVDMTDLLVHGDQFTNISLAAASGRNLSTLPLDAREARFPSQADLEACFSGTNKTVKHDGYFKPSILSTVMDATGQDLTTV